MANQGIDSLIEDAFVEFSHLRVNIYELGVSPLKEAESMCQLALCDILYEEFITSCIWNVTKCHDQSRVLFFLVLPNVLHT